MTKSQFVIIKHQAKRAGLHYDLRFKLPRSSMWASFAVRKRIPTRAGTRVLAVQTHNHTEKQALFTGIIKSGYGAGSLTKWDSGQCDIIKFTPAYIALVFHGSKIRGLYYLVNTGVIDKKYKQQTYMLFKSKSKDDHTY